MYVERLRLALARRTSATLSDEGARRAAVAVVVSEGDEPALLFVKRRERAGDPWSGHVALPGGFASPADGSPENTAMRETFEETGLDLSRLGSHLGRLDDVYPRSLLLPRVIVTPVVFTVASRHPVAPSEEVDRALWLQIASLEDQANRGVISLDLPAGPAEFTAIHVEGLAIWGLTERILAQLAAIAPVA